MFKILSLGQGGCSEGKDQCWHARLLEFDPWNGVAGEN